MQPTRYSPAFSDGQRPTGCRAAAATAVLFILLTAALTGCSLDGIWLQPRDNPRDIYYPPEIAEVYAGNLDTPLSSGSKIAANTTPLFVEFTQIMDQTSTGNAIRVFERGDRDSVLANTITWVDTHTARIDPDTVWDAGVEAALLVLEDAKNINEISMISAFTTYFAVPE